MAVGGAMLAAGNPAGYVVIQTSEGWFACIPEAVVMVVAEAVLMAPVTVITGGYGLARGPTHSLVIL